MVPDCRNVNIYQTSSQFQRLGGFCAPTDEAARSKLIKNAGLQDKWSFLGTYDVMRISILLSVGVGIFWMVLVQLLPKIMAPTAIFLGSILLLGAGVLLIADKPTGWEDRESWRIIIAIFLILFSMLFFSMLCLYRRRIKIVGVLLEYGGKFLASQSINFLYILAFIAFTLGLLILCLWEYLAYSSHSSPERKDEDIYL